jgi:hypothetical protein
MPAPRRYTDAQRAEMYRLYEAGLQPTEIARRCAAGTAGTEPFAIPRRSAHSIVKQMAKETGQEAPSRLGDIEDPDAVGRFAMRALAVAEAELGRLERKQHQHRLTLNDNEKLQTLTRVTYSLEKRAERLSRESKAVMRRQRKEKRSQSLIERLARDLAAGKESVGDQFSGAHAGSEPPEPAPP